MWADYYKPLYMEIARCDIYIFDKYQGHMSKVKFKVTKYMKITVLNRMSYRILVDYILFHIENLIWYIISVLTYDVPFLSHMTSYMFCKNVNFRPIGTILCCIGSHICDKANYVVIEAITLMFWSCYGSFMAPLWINGIFLKFNAFISQKLD